MRDSLIQVLGTFTQKFKSLQESHLSVEKEIISLESELTLLESSSVVIQDLVNDLSKGDLQELSKMLTWGLQTIFRENYEIRIDVKTQRNNKTFTFVFVKDGREAKITSQGGGVQSVVSLLLRLYAIAQLETPKFLILDEYFKHVDEERKPRFLEVLKTLCSDFKFDVLIISHDDAIMAIYDNHYRIDSQGHMKKIG